eukprot:TRINITY_DN27902_c0_g1_i1.p1 TRINITY_DN27902_c0_g1~~TRINITY_DN27902_c0_g1_i1.p1  ORF type:complete len:146 (+),score=31.59 TRINITY_DN27902_c0_g1_i1:84-521(+)
MGEEEEKERYEASLIRLKDDRSTLDLDDLDEDERKALAEVSKKGYYHNRPKTMEAPPPRRIENAEAVEWKASQKPRKRTAFDAYQNKWDKFEKSEPIVREVPSSPTSVSSPPTKPTPDPPQERRKIEEPPKSLFEKVFYCCKRRK